MNRSLTFDITARDKSTGTIAKINASIEKLTAPSRRLTGSLQQLARTTGVESVARSVGRIGSSAFEAARKVALMVPAIGALASAGSIAGVAALTSNVARSAVELDNLSRKLGISARELQEFEIAGRLVGLTTEQVDSALEGLGNTIEQATTGTNPEAALHLRQLGIEIHRIGESVDAIDALTQIADKVKSLKNAQAQQTVANAFGIGSMLPLLRRGSEGIKELRAQAAALGVPLSDVAMRQGPGYLRALIRMDVATQSFKNTLGEKLMPAALKVVDVITRLVAKYGDVVGSKVAEYAERLAKWIEQTDWDKVAKQAEAFVDTLGGLKGVALAIGAITFAGPIASVTALIAQLGVLATTAIPAVIRGMALLGGGGAAAVATTGAGAAAGGGLLASLFPWLARAGAGVGLAMYGSSLNSGEEEVLARRDPRNGQWLPSAKDSARKALGYFIGQGWTPDQAAGIVANMMAESKMNPGVTGDRGAAFGLGQWHLDRQMEFQKFAGKPIKDSSFEEQLAFAHHELTAGTEQAAGRRLRGTTTASQAGEVVSRYYERPRDADGEARKRAMGAAELAFDARKNGIAGKVDVTVNIPNLPAGGRVTTRSQGDVKAKTNVGTSTVAAGAF